MSILICYDGSDSARRALSVARATLGHQPATLLHVWEPPQPFLADSFSTTAAVGASSQELERLALERARELGREGCELARRLGLTSELRIERDGGEPADRILQVADELDVDLIVLGTRGTTAVQTAPLGSVSHGVVQRSRRPVLVVPSPDAGPRR